MELNRQEKNENTNSKLNSELDSNMKLGTILSSELKEKLDLGVGKTVQNWLQDFLKQLSERLEKMEEVLVVDRIEGDIAVCENRKNGKMKNVSLSDLPKNIQEGNVLKWKDGKYEIDTSKEIENRIEQKMKDVWK